MGVEEGVGWSGVGITWKPETREEVTLGIQGRVNGSCTGAGAVRLNGSGSFSLW